MKLQLLYIVNGIKPESILLITSTNIIFLVLSYIMIQINRLAMNYEVS